MATEEIVKQHEPKAKKTIVFDTNVILHDNDCLYHFDKHDIVVPIAVLEELDGFKRGEEPINVNARAFLHTLDVLSKDKIFNGGVKIGDGKGLVSVKLGSEWRKEIKKNFSFNKPDHHILNTVYCIAESNGFENVILVTKDVNLRMKAKSVGLLAEDYISDYVKNVSDIQKGIRLIKECPEKIMDALCEHPFEVDLPNDFFKPELLANEYLILSNGGKSVLATFNSSVQKLRNVQEKTCLGIKARNIEQEFALDALMNMDVPLVTLTGKAGTGKTLVALAAALELKKHYRQIFIARPAVPLSNKDSGHLPGNINSKLHLYMQPLFDNLSVIQNGSKEKGKMIQSMQENEKIKIAPLAYIRGRSIINVFFIIDEAQNLTPHEIKTIVTRAGRGTKIVFTGDIFQIDHPYLNSRSNGLSYLIERMKGQKLHAHINLEKGERSELSELAIQLL